MSRKDSGLANLAFEQITNVSVGKVTRADEGFHVETLTKS